MTNTNQFGNEKNAFAAAFQDLKSLEAEIEQRFGLQSLRSSADFALTQV